MTRVLLVILALSPATSSPIQAEYVGRNKVRYKKFEFQAHRRQYFDIYFYTSQEAAFTQQLDLASTGTQAFSSSDSQINGKTTSDPLH